MNLRNLFVLGAIIMTTAACSTTESDDPVIPTTSYPLSTSELAMIQSGVRAELGDPNASFGTIMAVKNMVWNGTNVCGRVISPATLGHSNPVYFFGNIGPSTFAVTAVGRNERLNQALREDCARFSMPI